MAVDEDRRFLIEHVRAVWLWIVIADCLKRIKISGCAGGLPAILCFSIVPWKNTLPTYLSAGRYAIISCANLLTQGPLHGMFLLLISKPAFYRWLNFAISWRLYNRRNGLPKTFFINVTLLCRSRTSRWRRTVCSCGTRFRYWPPVNSLTIYRWGYPLILGIMDMHYRFPYFL